MPKTRTTSSRARVARAEEVDLEEELAAAEDRSEDDGSGSGSEHLREEIARLQRLLAESEARAEGFEAAGGRRRPPREVPRENLQNEGRRPSGEQLDPGARNTRRGRVAREENERPGGGTNPPSDEGSDGSSSSSEEEDPGERPRRSKKVKALKTQDVVHILERSRRALNGEKTYVGFVRDCVQAGQFLDGLNNYHQYGSLMEDSRELDERRLAGVRRVRRAAEERELVATERDMQAAVEKELVRDLLYIRRADTLFGVLCLWHLRDLELETQVRSRQLGGPLLSVLAYQRGRSRFLVMNFKESEKVQKLYQKTSALRELTGALTAAAPRIRGSNAGAPSPASGGLAGGAGAPVGANSTGGVAGAGGASTGSDGHAALLVGSRRWVTKYVLPFGQAKVEAYVKAQNEAQQRAGGDKKARELRIDGSGNPLP